MQKEIIAIFKRAKKRILFVVFLLIVNAFISFSGLVAYTQEERRACDLLKYVYSFPDPVEGHNKLTKEQRELALKYLPSYKKEYSCMSFENFLINQAGIMFFGLLLVLIRRKDKKNISI